MVEDEEIVARLRRHQAEARDDRRERMAARAAHVTAGRGRRPLVLRGEEGRIDHHRALELVAEIARKAHGDAAAERMPDDDRRPGFESAAGAPRLARLAHELLENVSLAPAGPAHAGEGRGDDAMSLLRRTAR